MNGLIQILTWLMYGVGGIIFLKIVTWVIVDTYFARKEQCIYSMTKLINKALDKIINKEK